MQITSVVDGFLWISYVVVQLVQGLGIAGLGVILVLIAAAFWGFRRKHPSLGTRRRRRAGGDRLRRPDRPGRMTPARTGAPAIVGGAGARRYGRPEDPRPAIGAGPPGGSLEERFP